MGPQNVSLVRARENDEEIGRSGGVPTEKTSVSFCSYFMTKRESQGKKVTRTMMQSDSESMKITKMNTHRVRVD